LSRHALLFASPCRPPLLPSPMCTRPSPSRRAPITESRCQPMPPQALFCAMLNRSASSTAELGVTISALTTGPTSSSSYPCGALPQASLCHGLFSKNCSAEPPRAPSHHRSVSGRVRRRPVFHKLHAGAVLLTDSSGDFLDLLSTPPPLYPLRVTVLMGSSPIDISNHPPGLLPPPIPPLKHPRGSTTPPPAPFTAPSACCHRFPIIDPHHH
jgi:hypothetical protein